MKKLLVFTTLILSTCLLSNAQCGEKCGVVRWPVKSLSDTTVTNINFTPKRKTVRWLVNTTPPGKKPSKTRINGLEWINFRVKAVLVGYKKSPDDNDFHVVIKDLQTSETMIVEFKDPACSGVCDSRFITDMQKGRDDFLNSAPVQERGRPTSSFKRLSKRVIVELIGIGFWDHIHGQIGVARNGIELHPVIDFKVVP